MLSVPWELVRVAFTGNGGVSSRIVTSIFTGNDGVSWE